MPSNLERKLPQMAKQHGYLIMHMGTAGASKHWSLEKWKSLAALCSKEGYTILFTGRGEEENQNILAVTERITSAHNLCDQLQWNELVYLTAKARLVICVDTAIGHIAAAWSIPTLILFTGIVQMEEWRPANPRAQIFIHKVPCAPCFRKNGCTTMECIQGIEVFDVFEAGKKVMLGTPTYPV